MALSTSNWKWIGVFARHAELDPPLTVWCSWGGYCELEFAHLATQTRSHHLWAELPSTICLLCREQEGNPLAATAYSKTYSSAPCSSHLGANEWNRASAIRLASGSSTRCWEGSRLGATIALSTHFQFCLGAASWRPFPFEGTVAANSPTWFQAYFTGIDYSVWRTSSCIGLRGPSSVSSTLAWVYARLFLSLNW